MPRKRLIRTSQFYYHVRTRSNHKEWFQLPLDQVWRIICASADKAIERHKGIISQLVLMNNHYHLLVRTPQMNIDQFMYEFNKTFSDRLRKESGQVNRMFGSSYKWSIISNQNYYLNVYRYIYQNPLRAGVVTNCEDYPYSSLWFESRKQELQFKFTPLFDFSDEILEFLNRPIDQDNILRIRKGLIKTRFKEVFARK